MRKIKETTRQKLKFKINIQLFAGPAGATKIADVIVPEIFAGYMNKGPLELNAFYQSGIMVRDKEMNKLVAQGGYSITMPFWDELEGDYSQRTDNKDPAEFNKITAKREKAIKLFDEYGIGANMLASELAGSDALEAIRKKMSNKIATLDQGRIFSTLKGVFSSVKMADNVLDITSKTGKGACISALAITRAQGKLGDRQEAVKAIAMHSDTYTYLKGLGLISTVPGQNQGYAIEYYGPKRVIVDDALKPVNGVYSTYIFKEGAIAYGRGGEKFPVEVGKVPFANEEGVLVRKNHSFHVRGTTWVGDDTTMADTTAIETGTNWDKAYPTKQIPIVLLKHKIDFNLLEETPTKVVMTGLGEEIGKAIAFSLNQKNVEEAAGETAEGKNGKAK